MIREVRTSPLFLKMSMFRVKPIKAQIHLLPGGVEFGCSLFGNNHFGFFRREGGLIKGNVLFSKGQTMSIGSNQTNNPRIRTFGNNANQQTIQNITSIIITDGKYRFPNEFEKSRSRKGDEPIPFNGWKRWIILTGKTHDSKFTTPCMNRNPTVFSDA